MADEKKETVEEAKWWIERGPVKEREKKPPFGRGIIDQWVTELLKDYSQDQAVRNVVDMNQKLLQEVSTPAGEWTYLSLGIGTFPPKTLERIKGVLSLPSFAHGWIIDAGYSVRVLISGEPVGEKCVDINFTEAPSLDYWVRNELIEERLFNSVDDALKKLRGSVPRYLAATASDQ